jgi:tRNA nucleotidyltransferase/poly(A) polymerase
MLEEYYKILRAGSAEKAFRKLADVGLLEPTSHELQKGAAEPLGLALEALDAYRRRFESTPDTLTNAILLGTLLAPLGLAVRQGRVDEPPRLGNLPMARRDVDRLRQILALQRRLRDVTTSPRGQRNMAHRHIFRDALTWLEIHGSAPEAVDYWKALTPSSEASVSEGVPDGAGPEGPPLQRRRRRRRRRRRFSPAEGH